MERITAVNPAKAEGKVKQLFEDIQEEFGMITNLAGVLANSEACGFEDQRSREHTVSDR